MAERYDAVLIHGYQLRETKDGKFRSSLRGHMQIAAASQLLREGETNAVFLAVGPVWGDQYPAFSTVMEQELKSRLGISGTQLSEVIVSPTAMTTHEEIDLFLAEAQKRGWNNVASLANKTHQARIKAIYQRRHRPDIKRINTEDVLANVNFRGRTPYRPFLKAFKWSNKELVFRVREAVVTSLYKLGFENYLTAAAKSARVQKGKVWFDS